MQRPVVVSAGCVLGAVRRKKEVIGGWVMVGRLVVLPVDRALWAAGWSGGQCQR